VGTHGRNISRNAWDSRSCRNSSARRNYRKGLALIEEGRRLQEMELRVRAGLLRAQMDLQLGERDAAFSALDEVFRLLLPERPVRLLLDHPGIGALLAHYRRAARSRQISRQLSNWLDELERAASIR